jgi:hypothetical protein
VVAAVVVVVAGVVVVVFIAVVSQLGFFVSNTAGFFPQKRSTVWI